MTIAEAIAKLDELDRGAFICARRPWEPSAECVVTMPDDELRVPKVVAEAGFEYFLDVYTAREVLDVFGEKPPSAEERLRLLLFYGENDAYPDWVFER